MLHGQSRRAVRISNHIDGVVLTAFDGRFTFLRNTLSYAHIRLRQARNLAEADFLLTVTDATVLLSDVAVVDISWHAVMELLRNHHPATPMILVADPVDRNYVAPAIELGVWGILWIPVEFDVATKLIRTAHEAAEERKLFRREQMQPDSSGRLLIAAGAVRRGPRG